MVEFGASLEERMARFKTKDPDHNEAKARFIKHNQQERRSHERVVDDYEKRRAAEQKQRMGGLFDSLNGLKNRSAGGERPQLVGSMTDRLAGLRDQLRTDQQTEAPSRFSTNNNASTARPSRWSVPEPTRPARESPVGGKEPPREVPQNSGSSAPPSGTSIADKLAGLRGKIGMIHVDWPAEAVRWSNFEDLAAKKEQLTLENVPLPPAGWFKSGMNDKLYKQLSRRYHPDKFMQKFGKLFEAAQLETVMEAVVAAFQLLNDARNGV